jgi:uncharacterized protein (TIGR03118 family)
VEGLEVRALLSAGHDLIGHAHVDARRPRTFSGYQQTNLVSDIGGVAQVTDSSLVNPWGMAFSSSSPFWVSNQQTGKATLYSVSSTGTATKLSLTVAIPTTGSGAPTGPTGQVFNGSSTSFLLPGPNNTMVPAHFIFDTLQGTIEGWSPQSNGGSSSAVIMVNNSSTAEYTGLATGSSGGQNFLYAANDLVSPGIQVYNSSFTPVTLAGNFTDPKLPKGFLPYNIQNVGGDLFVAYRGPKFKGGAVAEFNTDGTFVKQIAANKGKGNLQSPWGVTVAPTSFGKFSGDLLVGNFSSGRIDAYTSRGRFAGQLATAAAKPKAFTIPFLWTLDFGNGQSAGPMTTLFFTAGIDNQTHGLFGDFTAVTITK